MSTFLFGNTWLTSMHIHGILFFVVETSHVIMRGFYFDIPNVRRASCSVLRLPEHRTQNNNTKLLNA